MSRLSTGALSYELDSYHAEVKDEWEEIVDKALLVKVALRYSSVRHFFFRYLTSTGKNTETAQKRFSPICERR